MAGIPTDVKVRDLTPQSKSVNLTVKVVSLGSPQSVASRDGGTRRVTEAVVGDETGTVLTTIWPQSMRARRRQFFVKPPMTLGIFSVE